MKPAFYVGLEVASGGSLPVMTRLVQILHGIQRDRPGLLALAFPRLRKGEGRHPGNLVRVFSDSPENLQQVGGLLQENERMRGYIRYLPVKAVPEDFHGPWIEYRRVRIPGKGSRLEESRANKLAMAEELPFLRAASKTNGHGFSLHIDAIPGAKTAECEPDSYGLSVSTRAFALPDM